MNLGGLTGIGESLTKVYCRSFRVSGVVEELRVVESSLADDPARSKPGDLDMTKLIGSGWPEHLGRIVHS